MTQRTTRSAGWIRLLVLCAAVSACGGSDSPAPAPAPSPAPNAAPTASITAAATGIVGTPMTLNATATDSDGNVTMVEFLDGTTVLGQGSTAPYSFNWTPMFTGAHSLTARATDNAGAITTSAAVTVTVNRAGGSDTQPPVVTITAPAAFASGLTGTVTFSANATDNVGVANVELQIDGTALATDTSAPYSATVDSIAFASGQHVLRARAIDAAGNQSVWSSVTVQFGGARTQPAGFTRNENFITGLSSATSLAELPDGRLLIAQQGGTLRMWNGSSLSTMLTLAVDSQGERGMLGVVPNPSFSANGFIYVYYTTTQNGVHNRVSRFTVSGNTAGSELILFDLPSLSATNHNGGALHFGFDGKLYVAVGENAVPSRSQDLNTPFGKMLRFNDDGTIPGDNPFCTTQGNLACAVWALGLRNPFTFTFQPGTGRMHVNDVGQDTWEEINVGASRANYGWPGSEGPDNVGTGITEPLFTYRHGSAVPAGPGGFFTGNAIIGGAFHPAGGPFPAPWRGGYFFSDLVTRFVGFIDLNNNNAAYSFGSVSNMPVGMLSASDGALLVLTQSNVVRFSAP